MNGPIAHEITTLLTAAFAPTHLDVINDSAHHHGHAGHDGSGESHFTVVIESAAFAGRAKLARLGAARRIALAPAARHPAMKTIMLHFAFPCRDRS